MKEIYPKFSHQSRSLWLLEWQSFHHTTLYYHSRSKKFILWKIAIIISIVRTQKTMRKEVNINIRRKSRKSLEQQQEEKVFRERTKKRRSFLSHHAHTICGFSQLNSPFDIFKDFAFKGLAFSSLSFEISLTTTWEST